MKIGAVIQARMGSTRLPGKVLQSILGKPVLWHIANRLKYSDLIDKIIIATTIKERDKAVVEMAKNYDIPCYAGKEEDLIDRFYCTAKLYKLDVIVRIIADCPLIEPRITDKVVSCFLNSLERYDCVSNAGPSVSYPHGMDIEVFSFQVIEKLWKEITNPLDREWFTRIIYNNPDEYKIAFVQNNFKVPRLRLTMDYQEDFDLINYIYENLYRENSCFFLEDILELYSRDMKVFETNLEYDEEYIKELKKRGGVKCANIS